MQQGIIQCLSAWRYTPVNVTLGFHDCCMNSRSGRSWTLWLWPKKPFEVVKHYYGTAFKINAYFLIIYLVWIPELSIITKSESKVWVARPRVWDVLGTFGSLHDNYDHIPMNNPSLVKMVYCRHDLSHELSCLILIKLLFLVDIPHQLSTCMEVNKYINSEDPDNLYHSNFVHYTQC